MSADLPSVPPAGEPPPLRIDVYGGSGNFACLAVDGVVAAGIVAVAIIQQAVIVTVADSADEQQVERLKEIGVRVWRSDRQGRSTPNRLSLPGIEPA